MRFFSNNQKKNCLPSIAIEYNAKKRKLYQKKMGIQFDTHVEINTLSFTAKLHLFEQSACIVLMNTANRERDGFTNQQKSKVNICHQKKKKNREVLKNLK